MALHLNTQQYCCFEVLLTRFILMVMIFGMYCTALQFYGAACINVVNNNKKAHKHKCTHAHKV